MFSLATSAIKLPSDAFTSPAKYYVQETNTTVNEMMSYFNTAGKAVPNMLEVCCPRFSLKDDNCQSITVNLHI